MAKAVLPTAVGPAITMTVFEVSEIKQRFKLRIRG